jgi:tetratricopeptide (TPR) repeat protein
MTRFVSLSVTLLLAVAAFGQQNPTPPATNPSARPVPNTGIPARDAGPKPIPGKGDRAAAYYHYSMAHIYEELVSVYGRSDLAGKAIDEYRLAIQNDPGSEFLNAGLAELYAKTGRMRDAVTEAQDILKRDPNNLQAHELLGRIYLRSLGDMQNGSQSQTMLKLAIEQYQQIVSIQPNNKDNHLLLGRLYRLNNEMLKAENEFKTAMRLDPSSEEAVTSLAYLYNEEGDAKRAIQALNSVADTDRSDKLYSALGYTYEEQKDYPNAIKSYRKAVELNKDNLDAVRGLAQNLMNAGQFEAALDQYRAITEANPEDAQTYLRMAEIYRRVGKFDMALDSLKKAEGLVQDSLEVPYNKAVIMEAQGNFAGAAEILRGLIQKTDKTDGNYTSSERNNRAVFLERLGSVYREMNNTPGAVEAFRKMAALGDDNAVRAYQQLIDTYRDAKQWPQATAVAKEAVAKLPKNRELRLVLDSQLADQGEPDKALADARGLLKGTAEDREIYIALAQMYSRLKRWPEAEQAIAKAYDLSNKPEDRQYVEFMRGSIFERQKKYEEAEQSFKRVLGQDPQNATALNYLGYMLADRGVRLEEALGYIKKAVQLDPSNGAYLDSLGWAYFKQGNYDQAEEQLRKASDRMAADPTIQEHLGDLYQKTGRLKLAAAHWERAIAEWNKTVPAEVDQEEMAKVGKKLESAKVKLARESGAEPNNK